VASSSASALNRSEQRNRDQKGLPPFGQNFFSIRVSCFSGRQPGETKQLVSANESDTHEQRKSFVGCRRFVQGQLDHNFTAEELSVSAWKMDKPSFGLRGFENDYPDSNKLFKSIDSQGGLVIKGFIDKVGDRTFRLTTGGITAASRIQPGNTEQQIKLERELARAVNQLISHPVFADWLADPTKPTKFDGAGHF
jgi:hypothetical protein